MITGEKSHPKNFLLGVLHCLPGFHLLSPYISFLLHPHLEARMTESNVGGMTLPCYKVSSAPSFTDEDPGPRRWSDLASDTPAGGCQQQSLFSASRVPHLGRATTPNVSCLVSLARRRSAHAVNTQGENERGPAR